MCPTPDGGLATTGYTSYHTFFNQAEDDHYVCPPGTVYLPPAPPVPGVDVDDRRAPMRTPSTRRCGPWSARNRS